MSFFHLSLIQTVGGNITKEQQVVILKVRQLIGNTQTVADIDLNVYNPQGRGLDAVSVIRSRQSAAPSECRKQQTIPSAWLLS